MQAFKDFLGRLTLAENKQLYIYALIVGIVAGFAAILFQLGLEFFQGLMFSDLAGIEITHPKGEKHVFDFDVEEGVEPRRWLILILPAIGGLVSGWLVWKFCPEAGGTGTDAMIDAFHNKVGKISALVPFVKGITTIITLGTGGSSGKEGPVAQIGAGIGSSLATGLGIGVRARRTLLLAGTAAGLGAIFQAPLGAAITAVEVLYREDIESDALIPCVISSVTAYSIFGTIFGFSHIFFIPEAETLGFVPGELLLFILMGLVCSGIGFVYARSFFLMRDGFAKLKIPPYLKPALGGLLVGIVAFSIRPEILGSGFGFLQEVISMGRGDITWSWVGAFALLVFLKIFATGATISSGGSGGVFAPSLFIGGMIGALMGGLCYMLFPDYMSSPLGAFVVVGMSSFFAGVANAPIAAVIMISEMTGGYGLLAPLMLVSVISIILSQKWSIYENQVKNKFFSKAHVGDMTIDVLEQLKVKSLEPYRQVSITSSHTLFHSGEAFGKKIHASDLVLVDHDDIFAGMVSLRDVHFDSQDPLISNLITLEDIMTPNVPVLSPDHNLHEALEMIMRSEFDKIPILDDKTEDGEPHLLGYVLYSDVLKKYHEEVNPNRVH